MIGANLFGGWLNVCFNLKQPIQKERINMKQLKENDKYQDIIFKTEQVLFELEKHYNEISVLENYREKLDKERFEIENK